MATAQGRGSGTKAGPHGGAAGIAGKKDAVVDNARLGQPPYAGPRGVGRPHTEGAGMQRSHGCAARFFRSRILGTQSHDPQQNKGNGLHGIKSGCCHLGGGKLFHRLFFPCEQDAAIGRSNQARPQPSQGCCGYGSPARLSGPGCRPGETGRSRRLPLG